MKTIFLVLSLLLLQVSCDNYKLEYAYVVDTKHSVCAQKHIESTNPLKFSHVTDWPLEKCDGAVAIHRDDFKPFQRWIEKIQRDYKDLKDKCDKFRDVNFPPNT